MTNKKGMTDDHMARRYITNFTLTLKSEINFPVQGQYWKEEDQWGAEILSLDLREYGDSAEECLAMLKKSFKKKAKAIPETCYIGMDNQKILIFHNQNYLITKLKIKPKIKNGKVSLSKEDLDMKNAEIRITGFVEFPVYKAIKKEAEALGIGYMEHINEILKRHVNDLILGCANDKAQFTDKLFINS